MRSALTSEHTVVTASLQNLPRMHIKRGCRVKELQLLDRQAAASSYTTLVCTPLK